ncbi:MAG: glycosyltransferase family 9 protein [Thermodesulfobacteriota bacterium]
MNVKIEGLKILDALLGRPLGFLARAFIQPRPGDSNRTQNFSGTTESEKKLKILVIRPGGIGDAALLYPLLNALKRYFNNSEIDVLAEKRNSGIFVGCSYIHEVFLYDSGPLFALYKTLKKNYDIVIDSEQWHRLSAVFAYLTSAPIRVGFATNDRSELFTHAVPYRHDQYEVFSFLDLASRITGDSHEFNTMSPFIPIDQTLISKFSPQINELRNRCAAIAGIFSGATTPERRWGISKFVALSEGLLKESFGIVIVGGNEEVDDSVKLEEIADGDVTINYAGKTSLIETAAIISQLDLLVSTDTGLMHIACGVGTPTVSLFGAGIQKKWAPIGNSNIALNKHLPCSPCTRFGYTPKCPYEVRCLSDISVEEVKVAVLELVSRVKRHE